MIGTSASVHTLYFHFAVVAQPIHKQMQTTTKYMQHLLGYVVSGVVVGQVLGEQPVHLLPERRDQVIVGQGRRDIPHLRHLAQEDHLWV